MMLSDRIEKKLTHNKPSRLISRSKRMDGCEEKIHGDKGMIWYTNTKTTKSAGAGCHAKGEGYNIVINLGSMTIVFQAEITAITHNCFYFHTLDNRFKP